MTDQIGLDRQPRSPHLGVASASAVLADVPAAGSADEVSAEVHEDRPAQSDDRYGVDVFWDQATSIPWRVGGTAAAISVGGFANWNWGSSPFRFNSEGWFGKETANMGMDKLGHAYSTYVLAEFFADGIEKQSSQARSASYTGAILAMGLMTYVEVFDGFSKDHGFSHEDLLADTAGALFSVARRSVPGLREKIDFRLLYTPSRSTWRALSCFPAPHCDRDGKAVRSPITDYSGQRYLLALKLSGFERFRRTPLRLVELHAGYYARGFTKEEEDLGEPLRRRLFVGAGLNVSELLFSRRTSGLRGAGKWALQYLQVPYTAVHSD
ncbi:MAG: YfiM family protein [Pseudomonadota bacterium]|nr:YfiM family protein [Pseudomonadota bacterium]